MRAQAERNAAHHQERERTPLHMDGRTTRHPGYAISLSCRWLVEKTFGWLKQTGPLGRVKVRGLHKVDWVFVFSCAAHNLLRLPKQVADGEPHKGKPALVISSAGMARR